MRALGLARALGTLLVASLLATGLSVPTTCNPHASAAEAAARAAGLAAGRPENPAPDTVTVTVTRSAAWYVRGTTGARITARLSGADKPPAGTMTVRAGRRVIATKNVPPSGVVSVRLPADLSAARHVISVTYRPAAGQGLRPRTATTSVTVRPPSAARLTLSRSAAGYRQGAKGVLVTARVSVKGKAKARGTISVRAAGRIVATRTLPRSGKVSVRLPSDLKTGNRTVKVAFTPKAGSGIAPAAGIVRVRVTPPAVRATLTVRRSAATHQRGKKGVLITSRVRLSGRAKPAGSIAVAVDGRTLATKRVPTNGTVKVRLPSRLDVGRHTVTVTYRPKAALKTVRKRVTTAFRVTAPRRVVTSSGVGTRYARGADVEKLAASYLTRIGARDVTVRWSLSCRVAKGMIYTSGRVSSSSTSVMRLCVSGDFSGAYARNSLRYLVAHEYGHLLYNRAVGTTRSVGYQSVANSERQADCVAAKLTGLPVAQYGSYTTACTGRLKRTAGQLIAGQRPASLGR